jgi:hypothetical protein
LFGYYTWTQQLKRQEAKRQAQIENLLKQSEEAYAVFDFDTVAQCYDELESLDYDISQQRKLLEYDMSVYEDAYGYYIAICDVDTKLHSGSYNSLRTLINTMKTPTDKFEALEINTDSEIGQYINNVRSNIMYQIFTSDYVYSDEYDLDYGLTKSGYAYIISTNTEIIVQEQFPYIEDKQSAE